MSMVPSSRRIPAGLLAIFLGSFGAHKFFLGMNRAGAVMVLLYVVGLLTGWLFGLGYFIIWALGAIGFIEGIVYLLTNDHDFYNKYVIRRQEWF